MKAKMCLFLLAFSLLGPTNMEGMALESSATQASGKDAVSLGHYLSRIIVRTMDGKIFYGLLLGIEQDELIMRTGATEARIALEDLAEVTVEKDKNPGTFMISGLFFSTYILNFLDLRAENQPLAYIERDNFSEEGTIIWNTIFAAAGVGLGYLVSLFERGEEKFRFSEGKAERLAKWEELKGYLAGGSKPKKIHLSIQAGQVITAVSHRYREAFTDAGYFSYGWAMVGWPDPNSYDYPRYISEATRFNLLRRAQLTVSVKPKIEIGAAVVFSGEPTIGGNDLNDRRVWLTDKGTGLYAVALYKPLLGSWAQKIQWNIGLGLGVSQVDLEVGLYSHGDYPDYAVRRAEYKYAGTVPSGLLMTELRFFLNPNLSLSLTADYVYGPSKNIPAFPEWNLPGQTVRLGNGCIGAAFGMHF